MRLIDTMIGLIGNPKFCDIDQAIKHALEYGGATYFEMVMLREDMTLKKAVEFAETVNDKKVWKILVARPDLNIKIAEAYNTTRVSDPKVWMAFLMRGDLPLIAAFCKAEELGKYNVLCAVLTRKDATPDVVVEYALLIHNSLFWEAALSKSEILTYLETLNTEKLLTIARSCKSGLLWAYILEKRIEKANDIIAYAIESNNEESYRVAIQKPYVIDYLEKLPADEALALVSEIEYPQIRALVLRRANIKPAKLLFWLSRVRDNASASWIMKRKDVGAYISKLSLKQAFGLSELIGYKNSCESKILKDKVETYLMTVSKRKALSLALSISENKLQALVLGSKRPDLSIRSVIGCAQKINDEIVWAAVVGRPDFLDYFDKMTNAKALQFAEKCGNMRVWARLLSWRKLPLNEIVSISRKLNSGLVWSSVKIREDVIAYLGLK